MKNTNARAATICLGLSLLLSSRVAAQSLGFQFIAPTLGTISYDGTPTGALVGTGLDLNTVVAVSTPLHDLSSRNCISCTFSFTTGSIVSSTATSWIFAAGGSAVVTGGVDLDNDGMIGAGDIPVGTVLAQGTFVNTPTVLAFSGGFRVLVAAFVDTKSDALVTYYGLPGGGTPYEGSVNLSFASNTPPPSGFSSTQAFSGDVTNLAPSIPTATPTLTRTLTRTPTHTGTPSSTPTATPTESATPTASSTPTASATLTASATVSATETATTTATPSSTATNTQTLTATPSSTTTNSPTHTESATPTPTLTPTPSATGSPTPSATGSSTPNASASPTPSPTASSSPTGTASPSETATPTLSHTATATPSGTATPSTTLTRTPTGTTTPGLTLTATPTNTPTPEIVEETATPAVGIDLAVEMRLADPAACGPNGSGSYLVTIRNLGDTTAGGPLLVTDPLPPGVTLVSAGGAGWQCSQPPATVVSCTFNGSLGGGASTSITIQVSIGPAAGSVLVNTVTVAGVSGELELTNNEATDTTICGVTGVPALGPVGFACAVLLLLGVAYFRLRSAAPSA